jgi:hypothetical protein
MVVVAEARDQASKQASSKLEEYRREQELSPWKFNVCFEDFMCAIVQWCWKCVTQGDFNNSCYKSVKTSADRPKRVA